MEKWTLPMRACVLNAIQTETKSTVVALNEKELWSRDMNQDDLVEIL